IGAEQIEIEARVETFGQTGVEMEALTACATAALAISDICRESDPLVAIEGLAVWEKRGGKSGSWRREPSGDPG
ncbi:MAG: cyclic pyranopterin monophosphate synthase MoaC, partial [Thermoplasmata archaeon]